VSFKVYIPARYASTRLPGKPLLDIGGAPLIQRVYELALASGAAGVVIATDDHRIRERAEAFGATVCITADTHVSGTDRLAEAVTLLEERDETVIVNLQGDEPLMPPALIARVARLLEEDPDADMATLGEPIDIASDVFDPNIVKLVMDGEGRALYFSRAPIPWDREQFNVGAVPGNAIPDKSYIRHIGIYAYRVGYLKRYARLPPCWLESVEKLEQLRALHYGARIRVSVAAQAVGLGVDTPADLDRVRACYRQTENSQSESAGSGRVSVELPPQPPEPAPDECCGRGCERCVYVYYEEAMARWRQRVRELTGGEIAGVA
jgi:3-deoxy-manno-octulosonate cytidylyltransferase (CMP-KDO synthetase)